MQIKVVKDWIVFPTRNPEKAMALFPELKLSKYKDYHICAVPHTLDHVRFLCNKKQGLKLPSPIATKYDWPGLFSPFAHQIETADFLAKNPRAFLLNGMGTGKTSSSIWAMDYLRREGKINKALILAPLSTLTSVWVNEIFRITPRAKVKVLYGSRERRLELLAEEADYYIINHDGISIIREALAKRTDINHVTIDELGYYRNQQTKRWKTAFEIVNRQCCRSCWGLTGTPTPNAPTDAYAQMKLVRPENYRGPFMAFKQDTMYQVTKFKWAARKGAEKLVSSVLTPNIRFALEDCIDLPPTIYQTQICELSEEQKQHYADLEKHQIAQFADDQVVTAANAAVLINKLTQVAAGCLYGDGTHHFLDVSDRLAALREIADECNEKIIVFAPFTEVLHIIAGDMKKHWKDSSYNYRCEIVDGSVGKTKRDDIFYKFQHDPTLRMIVANAGTMSHGLTLVAASTIVWFAPTNNNDTYNQANARIVRPGQKNITHIVHLCATEVENKIYTGLKEKTRLQDVVLSLAKKGC